MHKARSEAGFTLVEVLVASVILLVGVLGTVTVLQARIARQRHDASARRRDQPRPRPHRGRAQRAVRSPDGSGCHGPVCRPSRVSRARRPASYTIRRGAVLLRRNRRRLRDGRPARRRWPSGRRAANALRRQRPSRARGPQPRGLQEVVTPTITWRRGSGRTRSVVQSGDRRATPAARAVRRSARSRRAATSPRTWSRIRSRTSRRRRSSPRPRSPHASTGSLDGTVQQPAPVRNGPQRARLDVHLDHRHRRYGRARRRLHRLR